MSDFAQSLRERLLGEGPITVERYMALCIEHYYATRDPFGASGDFTTAPEISQIFGELIGLWMVAVWEAMGRPSPVRLIELGPGRGTLMADGLRAARLAPDFLAASRLHLVETSPVLRERQQSTLAGAEVAATWHPRLEDVPEGPALLVANEFFDALPIRQFLATERGWCERLVWLERDAFIFGLDPEPTEALGRPPRIGAILEHPSAGIDLMRVLAGRLAQQGGAALCIDYGYLGPAFGETLQALKSHLFVDTLAEPGDADLTAHVDFHRLADAAAREGVNVFGPVRQADFLNLLGLKTRAESLKRGASDSQRDEIDEAVARLTGVSRTGMGELFKALGLSHPALTDLPGLPFNAALTKG